MKSGNNGHECDRLPVGVYALYEAGCGIHLYQAGQVGGDYPVNDSADGGVRTGRL